MTPERWQQVEAILQSALDISSGAESRARFVADACAGDDDLRRAVERLLGAADGADSFIESPAWLGATPAPAAPRPASENSLSEKKPGNLDGRRIGAFVLTRELGRGGMGAVFLGERADGEFQQTAAIKLIKRGMDTDFIIRRFRQERQILAALDHPNIARLIDGGTTDNGLPYFVLEYVAGESLYNFADARKLTVEARLKLFQRICAAIEYAHKRGVVHRDLKPSNILVKASGEPKLLDFGIAKVLNPELGLTTVDPTATAMRMMTPEYASPEQIKGETVTPAADVYSLGVILYEFLSGHRPYRLKNRAAYEIARAVCEDEPERPSERVTREDDFSMSAAGEKTPTLESLCESRGAVSVEELRRLLSGDLESIVLKALRKTPFERYQTVSDLAADIENYLRGNPVAAPSVAVVPEFSKSIFAERNDSISARKSIAVLPLKFIGAAQETGDDQYLSVGLADAVITRLSNVRRIVVRPTSSVLPFAGQPNALAAGRELAVDYVLTGTIRRSGERIRVSGQLLDVAANATLWAANFDENSRDVLGLEDAVSENVARLIIPKLTGEEEEKLQKRGTDSPVAYEAYLRGRYHLNLFTPADFARAFDYLREAVRLDPEYALAYASLAEYYFALGTFGTATPRESFHSAGAMARRAVCLDDALGEAYAILAFTHYSEYRLREADETFRRAVRLSPNFSIARVLYSALLIALGEYDRAVDEARRAAELNPLAPFEQINHAWMLYQSGRSAEAAAKAERTIEIHPEFAHAFGAYGWILRSRGELEESLRYAERAVRFSPQTPWLVCNLAATFAKSGVENEARRLLKEIETNPATADAALYAQAIAYCALGERETAFAKLEAAYKTRDPWLLWLASDAEAAPLSRDKKYQNLLRRIGNPVSRLTETPDVKTRR